MKRDSILAAPMLPPALKGKMKNVSERMYKSRGRGTTTFRTATPLVLKKLNDYSPSRLLNLYSMMRVGGDPLVGPGILNRL